MTSGGLPKYEKYRPARLSWLGEIPAHWEEKRAKFFFREVDERSAAGEEELLSVSHVTGVTPRSQKNITMFKAESYAGHKMCRPGDLVINTMWAWMAALGVARQTGIVSSSYGVYRPIKRETFTPEYVDRLLRTKPYATEYFCRSTGIRPSRLRLYPEKFLDIPVACPPRDEQERMVNYLRDKDRQIHRFIRNKRRRIELLNEQKLVIINRAVTRGLDSSVRLKPSGVDWLGHVPEHWDLVPLKYVSLRTQNGATPPTDYASYYEDGTVPWYGPSSISDSVEVGTPVRHLNLKAFQDGKARAIKAPALLVVVIGTVGRAGLLLTDGSSNQQITSFEIDEKKIQARFVAYQFSLAEAWFRATASSATIPILDSGLLSRSPLAIPSEREQKLILTFLQREEEELFLIIAKTKREIELVRAYRTQLIADVVTGKVDVRHIAPEAGKLTLDEAELLEDANELLLDEEAEDLEASEEETTLADD